MSVAKNTEFVPVKVQEYIAGNIDDSADKDWAQIKTIAELTALRLDSGGEFYVSNFWRGPMLYSLVRRLKPSLILELGTGRGYGAFCMAMALKDGNIDGKLVTVDRTPGDTKYDWAFTDSNNQNRVLNTSLHEFWEQNLPKSLRERIEFRCGDTAAVHDLLADFDQPVDLVFIDGDHSYNGVALDFLSSHAISAPNAVFVFDDYSAASGYGIRTLINDDISRFYSVKVIDMDPTAAHDISVDHMMAICNDEAADVVADLPRPSDFRFRYLTLKRWGRSQLIRAAKTLLRR